MEPKIRLYLTIGTCCWKGEMFCINSLYKKRIYLVEHIMEKGNIQSLEHFQNIWVNHKELLMIMDIFRGIPASWKEQTDSVKFQEWMWILLHSI